MMDEAKYITIPQQEYELLKKDVAELQCVNRGLSLGHTRLFTKNEELIKQLENKKAGKPTNESAEKLENLVYGLQFYSGTLKKIAESFPHQIEINDIRNEVARTIDGYLEEAINKKDE